MKQLLNDLVQKTIETLFPDHILPSFQIEKAKDPEHGDYACNIALIAAKILNMPPREIAQKIVDRLPQTPEISRTTIAGPGFINFTLTHAARFGVIKTVLEEKETFGKGHQTHKNKILLEFISSNPTGPLHVGHGRSAAYGASLASLMKAAGYDIHCEYYVNDAGRQMEILAASLWLRYLELGGQHFPFPANAYQGDYVKLIAEALKKQFGSQYEQSASNIFQGLPPDEAEGGDKETYIDAVIEKSRTLLGAESFQAIQSFATEAILNDMKNDLAEFGVHFDSWFSEKSLFDSGALEKSIIDLKKSGYTQEKEGALWFNASHFGDEKDRVVIRANGKPTYFASDVAYHWNKYQRGYNTLINIFGADHHGYIPRLKAVVSAFGKDPETLEVLIVQFAILYRGKERVSMSTRSGSFITLRQLREEVGNDAARFFYVMRKADQHMDFDLELAKSESSENPVYYIQYAHARICSIFKQMKEKQQTFEPNIGLEALGTLAEEAELNLTKMLSYYPELITSAARSREPHQLAHYLRDLAHGFHTYYNAHTFLVEDQKLRNARLCLIMAVKQVIKNGLTILGVSTPEQM